MKIKMAVEVEIEVEIEVKKKMMIMSRNPNHDEIFLVHPNIKDSKHYRLNKTISCQKLSQEACSHAAQNERLPVQMVAQVLYFEQIRLRNAMNRGHNQFFFCAINGQFAQQTSSGIGSHLSLRQLCTGEKREPRAET
ncbi:hypothetical protein J1N35_011842 [Gossypium stocksii]|uniref:NPH3 domain-containing protein n=1 Tax=Gossypium stocksii TaxID=47602 RepID=A0A9D4ADP5_9ROSI|nr:hypothetical protein J1N35_011842 [Gossypium stocksii]